MPRLVVDIETVPDISSVAAAFVPSPLNCLKRLTATGKFRPLSWDLPSLRVDDGLETAVAFPTAPNMMDSPLTPILGPFGGN
jgi:hypothetical protein